MRKTTYHQDRDPMTSILKKKRLSLQSRTRPLKDWWRTVKARKPRTKRKRRSRTFLLS
jgi:hypothetical protein